MNLVMLFAAVSLVFGGPLTHDENEKLQKKCGQTDIKSRYSRSMESKSGTRTEAPFTVLLHSSFEEGAPEKRLASGRGICTGTIISPRHILTAGHCITDFSCKKIGSEAAATPVYHKNRREYYQKLDYLFVSAPTNCQDNSTCDSSLEKVIVKPKLAFIPMGYKHLMCGTEMDLWSNLAVIELEEDIAFSNSVQPACLYTKEIVADTDLTIFGYGNFDDLLKESVGLLEKHSSKVITGEECLTESYFDDTEANAKIPREKRLKSNVVCCKDEKPVTCGASGGSGLVLKDEGVMYVTAIHGGGPSCPENLSRHLSFGIRVSSHLDWICAVSGVCPRGYLAEEQKADYKKKSYIMEVRDIFPNDPHSP